jgi:hypothetical protein
MYEFSCTVNSKYPQIIQATPQRILTRLFLFSLHLQERSFHVRKNHFDHTSHGAEYLHACYSVSHRLFVLPRTQEGQKMTQQEREILYKLLIDLFVESPRNTQTSKSEKGEDTHEKVSTNARRARQLGRKTNTPH